ncbi:MAG: hypothetical protein RMX63_11385 [Aulosira sp. ZfuCHP01]|nr:hypothetical protein [Aulosira sp. ZfuCHP01]
MSLKSLIHGAKSLIHGVKSLIHGVKSLIHGVKSLAHGAESLIHGAKSLVHAAKSLIHAAKSLIHAAKSLIRDIQLQKYCNCRGKGAIALLPHRKSFFTVSPLREYGASQLDAIQNYIVACRGIGTAVPLRVCGLNRYPL